MHPFSRTIIRATVPLMFLVISMIVPPGGTLQPQPAVAAPPLQEADTNCLYPSVHERFGVTVTGDLDLYDVSQLPFGAYLNWLADADASHPNDAHYYPIIHTFRNGYHPSGADLEAVVLANPGATWIIGSEADTIWMDNTPPENYARNYHDAYTTIMAIDPTAKFMLNGLATVSTLRLEWLNRVWDEYLRLYGTDIPVDVWNIHTYVVNEMHLEWGAEIPAGISNAVGYTAGLWTEATVNGASGGTVHQSRTAAARAYFAFQGSTVTIGLRTGPDAGIARVHLDGSPSAVETIDLYAQTPGAITRTYSGLAPSTNARVGNRHHARIQVTGTKNSASSNTWVRVDYAVAESTAGLPGGRLENNSPLQANIVSSVEDHDNLEMIVEQIRRFRQWMADHGQRNKPLVNTEYGVLMTEDLGFDYQRVRTFMLDSFQEFVFGARDPVLGYPEDDNRLLQQWFWFALNIDTFEGRTVHTGLFSPASGQIKQLGRDFIAFVEPLAVDYADLTATSFSLSPTWPLFAGQPSLVAVEAKVNNRGNLPVGPFSVTLVDGNRVVRTWPVNGLSARYAGNDVANLSYAWRPVVYGDRRVELRVNEDGQVAEPCADDNVLSANLEAELFTDLALSNLRTVPRLISPIAHNQSLAVTLQVDVANLGSLGTNDTAIQVDFWHGDPAQGGSLLTSKRLLPGNTSIPVTLSHVWQGLGPGFYDVVVDMHPASEETNLGNNRQELRVVVPAGRQFLPVLLSALEASR